MIPAFPHIGTLGFLANRMQLQPSQKPFQIVHLLTQGGAYF